MFLLRTVIVAGAAALAWANYSYASSQGGFEVVLSYEQYKACEIAYEDYKKVLTERPSFSQSGAIYVADIKNYRFKISRDNRDYVIEFALNQPIGESIKGGGARYVISKSNLSITKRLLFK